MLVAERGALATELPVTWAPPARLGTDAAFLVYFGEGPAYALLREGGQAEKEREPTLYHSSDPVLVEHLAFQLGHELGVPIGG